MSLQLLSFFRFLVANTAVFSPLAAHTLHTPTSPPTTLPAPYLASLWSDYEFLKGFPSCPIVAAVLGPAVDDGVSFPRLVAHTMSQGSVFGLLPAVEIVKTSPEGLHLISPLTPGEVR